MAIFSVISVALIALLRQSTAFLEKGQAGSEVHDIVDAADAMFAEDFANVYIQPSSMEGEPDVRMYCDRISFPRGEKGEDPVVVPRLMFVRSMNGEMTDVVTRDAGSRPGAGGRLDGVDDEREAGDGDLRAPGGKMEVMYGLLPGMKDQDPALGTLYRGTRTPIGGRDSFLPWETWSERAKPTSRMGVHGRTAFEERLRPVATGVLHLSFGFWSRHTRLRDARVLQDGEPQKEVPPSTTGGGLSLNWDSTRGILPRGIGPEQFFLARTPASLADPLDDVFPSGIRVTLVLERIGRDARPGELATSLARDDSEVHVEDTRFAPGGDPLSKYLKVGDEWMRWDTRTTRSFHIAERGVRGTTASAHEAGTPVHAGAALVRDYRIPVYRDDWND